MTKCNQLTSVPFKGLRDCVVSVCWRRLRRQCAGRRFRVLAVIVVWRTLHVCNELAVIELPRLQTMFRESCGLKWVSLQLGSTICDSPLLFTVSICSFRARSWSAQCLMVVVRYWTCRTRSVTHDWVPAFRPKIPQILRERGHPLPKCWYRSIGRPRPSWLHYSFAASSF